MRSMKSCTLRRISAVLLALLLAAPAALADDLASDLGGGYVAADPNAAPPTEVDMTFADVVIGYIEPGFAEISPVRCTEWDMISINQLVYEPVVDMDDSMKPIPMLADNWEQDGKYWKFNLRSGIQFHNGLELTAYDVVASYQAILAAGSANPYYARLSMIKEMQAMDVYTVIVKARNSSLLTLYAMNFPVMQYETVNDQIPRGTGPYWYIQYDPDGTIRLEANPLWWKKQPGVQSILLRRYDTPGDAIEAIQTRQISMLSTKSPKASFSRKLADLTSLDYPTLTYEMLVPNLSSSSIMSDINVRKAVMYAIDRSLLAANAYLDMTIQSEVPVVPNCWLYESQSAIYYYSPERALQMMNNSGWIDLTGDGVLKKKNGIMLQEPRIQIITYNESTNSIREKAVYMIKDYLEAIGINVTVSVLTRDKLRDAIKHKEYDLALIGVNLSEIPEITSIVATDGSLNYNGYSDNMMDMYINAAHAASNEETLLKAYSDMQLTIADQLPILGLLFRTGTVLSSRPIGGLSGLRAYDNFNGFEFLK